MSLKETPGWGSYASPIAHGVHDAAYLGILHYACAADWHIDGAHALARDAHDGSRDGHGRPTEPSVGFQECSRKGSLLTDALP